MKQFISEFEEYCKKPGVTSNKASSYAKAIQYLCDYLDISTIDEQALEKIKEIENEINDKNSSAYSGLLLFLENRRQRSYLESGFIRAALKPFYEFVEISSVSSKAEDQRNGRFDSWEIIDETTAVKHCDKSFWEHNGSGVPKGICWFFDAENLVPGETRLLTLVFEGKTYRGRIANDSTDRRRVRIFWNTDLGKEFASYKSSNSLATFIRRNETTYEISIFVDKTTDRNAWLLTWNPDNWTWDDFNSAVKQTRTTGNYQGSWSCVNTHVKPGDRIYLSILGTKESNGIIASGYATSETFEAEHWDTHKKEQGLKVKKINVNFDWIIDYNINEILRQDVLKRLFPEQHWSPQASGIQIQDKYVLKLEQEWNKFCGENEWWPSVKEYHPGLTKENWISLLRDPNIFNSMRLTLMAQFYAIGGQASCVQMAETYGNTSDFYRMACGVHLAERIYKETGCPICNQENAKYWPLLFVGRDAKDGERGNYIWKLRNELKEALEEINIMQFLGDNGGEEELLVKDTIASIKKYIAAKGFSYEDGLIENFYLSLKSKPFVILAGTSGTGKTRLVKLFAEAVGATTNNGRYKMVSVRPDWSDSTDLFGHVTLNDEFVKGAVFEFIWNAQKDLHNPYFLCLDEMNLARVEYYMSDFLSVIETRERTAQGHIVSELLISSSFYGKDRTGAATLYGELSFPENLYIIGTVNMDETTFPFSRKVLDRANTIEFSYVDLMPRFDKPAAPPVVNVSNAFLKTKYLLLDHCMEESESVSRYCLELQKINRVLQKANAHVGYRVRDEIVFYLLNNKEHDLFPENLAMDNELMQKILPRIQGSNASVKAMLCELFKLCAGDYDGFQSQSDNVSDKMKKALNDADRKIKYRHSAEKIELMTRRFEEDGFTSYWL